MEGSRFLGSLVALATLVLSLSTPVTESAHAASVGRGPTVPYVENFTGTIGVYAVTVDPQALTFAPLEAVEYQADASHPLASSFKPAVLYEALADIDAGSLAWRDRIAISSARSISGSSTTTTVPTASRIEAAQSRSAAVAAWPAAIAAAP